MRDTAQTVRSESFGARVLVISGDPHLRLLLRVGLETDGFFVLEAATRRLGERLLRLCPSAVVVSSVLPDGDGPGAIGAIRDRCPDARFVVLAPAGEPLDVPADVEVVDETAVTAVLDLLAPLRRDFVQPELSAPALVTAESDSICGHWAELCQWDPLLPPESEPLHPDELLQAISGAVGRPQPLGWGADPELESAVSEFTAAAGSTEVAIEQLVCLRQALLSCVLPRVPRREVDETRSRLNMLVDRAIGLAARQTASRLEAEAYSDPLTGLANRRAFDRDLRRELRRADRYARPLTVVMIDVNGLKGVNDNDGHLAGDLLLKSLGVALAGALRQTDGAYRVGGDEFALVLPETDAAAAHLIVERIADEGPAFSWGTASLPADGSDAQALVAIADARQYDHKHGRTDRALRS